MSAVSREAFQREMTRARETSRGDILKVVASFAHEDGSPCPVRIVRIFMTEERGRSKPIQIPAYCTRCRLELTRFIGLQVGW
jgi:hypothetical protein